MRVTIDRQQGANAWLTVAIREGRNREVRRALQAVGLTVNRLIRVSYGPFQLGDLTPGAVEEVRAKTLREQLGIATPPGHGTARRTTGRPRARSDGSLRPMTRGEHPGSTGAAWVQIADCRAVPVSQTLSAPALLRPSRPSISSYSIGWLSLSV